MAKVYRPYDSEQQLLLPPSLNEWLPEDRLARFVDDLVPRLDLSAITSMYEVEERGYPPYHPTMMTKVLLYGYAVGVYSGRKLAKELETDVAFRYLTAQTCQATEPSFGSGATTASLLASYSGRCSRRVASQAW